MSINCDEITYLQLSFTATFFKEYNFGIKFQNKYCSKCIDNKLRSHHLFYIKNKNRIKYFTKETFLQSFRT